mgnify:FL=1
MKKNFTLLLAVLCSIAASAQITFDQKDLAKKDTLYKRYQVHDTSWWDMDEKVDVGTAGANGVYDFTKVDTLGFDTGGLYLVAPGKIDASFGANHPTATMGVLSEKNVRQYREEVAFTKSDYAKKGHEYIVKDVDTGGIVPLRWMIYYGMTGNGGYYNFEDVELFSTSTVDTVKYLDPANTPWSSKFSSASTAKLADISVDGQGNKQYEIYEFYEEQGNNLVKTGVGARVDQGILAGGSPTGIYVNTDAVVKPAHRVHSTNLKMGYGGMDSSIWRASVNQGFTTLNHYDYTLDSFVSNGTGTAYLPKDSFQVTQVVRYRFHASVDSILVGGNLFQVQVDTQSVLYYEYWTKGFGEPIVRVGLQPWDSTLISFEYIDTVNSAGFGKLKADTMLKLYSFFKESNSKVEEVGLSAILDIGAMLNGNPTGSFDTLHAQYSSPQLYQSASMTYGFTNKDSSIWDVTFDLGNNISLNIETAEATTMAVDGYGKLYLREDSADVLRMKVQTIEYQTQTTLLGGFPISTDYDTSYTYEMFFWAKRTGIPLVQVEFADDQYDYIYDITFTEVPDLPTGKDKMTPPHTTVFPNPAKSHFTVMAYGEKQIELVDITGKVVATQQFTNRTTISTQDLNSGIYLARIKDQNTGEIQTVKVIIE